MNLTPAGRRCQVSGIHSSRANVHTKQGCRSIPSQTELSDSVNEKGPGWRNPGPFILNRWRNRSDLVERCVDLPLGGAHVLGLFCEKSGAFPGEHRLHLAEDRYGRVKADQTILGVVVGGLGHSEPPRISLETGEVVEVQLGRSGYRLGGVGGSHDCHLCIDRG